MGSPKFGNEVHEVSVETASIYVRRLVQIEQVSAGSKENALIKVARDYGLTVSQLVHLYKGRAKTCDVGLFARVRRAYLDRCARMIEVLQHEIAVEEAVTGNASDQDLAARAAALASEVAAQRAGLNARKQVK